jgi:hypothetical protein
MTTSKEIKTGRPRGRPPEFVGRYHATVRLTPQRYADIKGNADIARRSINEEIEARLERLAAFDSALAAMGTSLEQIKQGNLEAELVRGGYSAIRDAATSKKLWVEPGFPGIQHSWFIDESWNVHLRATASGERVLRAPESDERALQPQQPTVETDERVKKELEDLRELRRRIEVALMPPAKSQGEAA